MAAAKRRRKESAPGWAWMLFGLSIGLSVALVVYLRSGGPESPLVSSRTPAAPEARADTQPAAQRAADAGETPAPAAAEPDESDDEPALSFFNDLSKSEVIVDTDEFDFGGGGAPRVVLIQAGAFRDIDDADARQASLALLGYESHIDTGIVAGDLWFRVLIGPVTERGEINEAVRRLRSAGIETVLRTVTN